jgi:D-arabinose 1-dehydrogenase-like Zn-dependent alcohol dehydrogenase
VQSSNFRVTSHSCWPVHRAWPLFFDGYNLHSSLVASRGRHDDMLDFAVHHHIKPSIEKFEMSENGIAEALKKLAAGAVRYRGVLVAT